MNYATRLVVIILVSSPSLLFVAVTPSASAQDKKERVDYYIKNGKHVKLTIVAGKIGIVTQPQKQPDLNLLADNARLKFDRSLPGNIQLLKVEDMQDIDELERLVRAIRKRNAEKGPDAIVKDAGIVVQTEGSKTPMLVNDEFVVEFQDDVPQQFIDELIAKYKLEVVRKDELEEHQFVLRSTEESGLSFLEAPVVFHETGRINFAHPNFIRPKNYREQIPNDPLFGQQWHHKNTGQSGGTIDADIDTPQAWDFTCGSDKLIIAVIDNGFDYQHPDLVDNLWVNPGETPGDHCDNDHNGFVDDIHGWDFDANDNDPEPPGDAAHGTKVAGCVGARGNNLKGVSGTCQICRLMLLKRGHQENDDARALNYARKMGAQVITNSWGDPLDTVPDDIINAINKAATKGRGGLGAIILFAMNNTNHDDCGSEPDISSLSNVIAVSRATNQDRFDKSGFGTCMDVLGPTRSNNSLGTLGITTTTIRGLGDPTTPDYVKDFGGTSAATPITAGIVGLMVDVSPGLSRLKIQRALQDTTDKIEDSVACYATQTGFSTPGTGPATHGYGRVNAFEAVKLLAAEAHGGRGGVDIFFRDNRLDWGNTEQPSNTLFEATRGFISHCESVDIKVDAPPYQAAPTNSQQFDDVLKDEDPLASQTNRVFVRIRNRGPHSAKNVVVKLHWAFAGTTLPPLPSDFWAAFPADSADTSTWHPLEKQEIKNLDYCGASVAHTTEDKAQLVMFQFIAPALDPSQPAYQNYCLYCVSDSPQDSISGASRLSLDPNDITPQDNNITQRNVTLQPAAE